ncbi:MAG: protein-L-isoaspartate(D-aspartate) O-methyltransferase [Candidatus Parvarchaeota archaeon]|nr:protein-L-isoaspartate(D-aspartate) O-methyltransferase [Candidatus Jingweiarchaeum tengchongense]MCW1297892.1 protein-L-isoaspartate(D-aspartate) O-methyltransferase [Candidatus Jingweiarchaeum tengchongense]MCW1299903.1 protein-L-isoaspartate(D-aspartate) O-methyltransferase [Candidatus Jingweiarchaeum tengchongense]MCW1305093.1 protein-L-isoaspartate(D-aspartate) O-methyltransferase [Candidatus Jingweiarchaeum tengchongense]MCW1305155.1 protein-L-isoaspartate(D-aspartate) O-methyltransfer
MQDRLAEEKERLLSYLVKEGILKTPEIIRAFYKVEREKFVLEQYKEYSYADTPLPILYSQTISQPTTIAIMTEALEPKKGNKILEVGAGSGYQAAILAEIVGDSGKIYTIERISELVDFARRNLNNAGYRNVEVYCGDGSIGLREKAPFDRIIVTACAPKIPNSLIEQLVDGGIMVIPVGPITHIQRLFKIKKEGKRIKTKDLGFFAFVPLIGREGFK